MCFIWYGVEVEAELCLGKMCVSWFEAGDNSTVLLQDKEMKAQYYIKFLNWVDRIMSEPEYESSILNEETVNFIKSVSHKTLNIWINLILNKTVTVCVVVCTFLVILVVRYLFNGRPILREKIKPKTGTKGEAGVETTTSSQNAGNKNTDTVQMRGMYATLAGGGGGRGIDRLQNFEVGNDPEVWFTKFEASMKPFDKKSWYENLILFVSDACLSILNESGNMGKFDDYEALKVAILNKFGQVRKTKMENFTDFTGCFQKKNETVGEYALRLRNIAEAVLSGLDEIRLENLLVDQFAKGLEDPRFKNLAVEKVLKYRAKNKTLDLGILLEKLTYKEKALSVNQNEKLTDENAKYNNFKNSWKNKNNFNRGRNYNDRNFERTENKNERRSWSTNRYGEYLST